MLAGLGLAGILLRCVSHLGDRRTPKQRVVVERHLGVQRQQSVVLGDDQRVDLDHRRIQVAEGPIASEDRGHGAAHLFDVQAEPEGDLAGLERLHPDGRLDLDLADRIGLLLRDLFDFDAAFV